MRERQPQTELRRGDLEIPLIEGDQGVDIAIERSLQNHVIVGVRQKAPPEIIDPHGMNQVGEAVQERFRLIRAQAGGLQVVGSQAHGLVFQTERERG